MDTVLLVRKFEAMGARLKIGPASFRHFEVPSALTLDVRHDHRGEFFDLKVDDRQVKDLDAIDVQASQRHLLLLAWTRPFKETTPVRWNWRDRGRNLPPPELSDTLEKPRFLCGHDERHWFVAAVPEEAHASTVRTAMEALKPEAVRAAQSRSGVTFAERFRRKNRAFVRQGEWFFLPRPELVVPRAHLRTNEPLQRSGGKAHWAELAYRQGGEAVYVSTNFPQGLTESQFRTHVARHPKDQMRFRRMLRNATLFVRGRISHPDHATITLHAWHEVVMNTENRAEAGRNVVFLD